MSSIGWKWRSIRYDKQVIKNENYFWSCKYELNELRKDIKYCKNPKQRNEYLYLYHHKVMGILFNKDLKQRKSRHYYFL